MVNESGLETEQDVSSLEQINLDVMFRSCQHYLAC